MEPMWIILGILLALILIVGMWLVATYNKLVNLRNRVRNAWSQIDVQLQRRHDLIPSLVETVKGYAAHERGTFEEVTKARTAVMTANSPQAKADAENVLGATLKSLFAVAEAYPQLQADQNFRELQLELSDTEDKISYMRQSYNDTVMRYNTAIQQFPAVVVASMMGFHSEQSFDAETGSETVPKFSF